MKNNITREDLDAVIDHLKKDDPILTNGPFVREFEKQWSNWLKCKYSVYVNSGSSANLLTMAMLKIKYPEGGEVIVPPFTWVSDIASVIQCGFDPVFVDINPNTLAMDTDEILKAITPRTRAVFITHAQGFVGLTHKLLYWLDKKKIPLIEDVCESHGARFNANTQKLGTFGWISNFSFYYAHHMSTIEGGMVCTNDENVYQTVRMLRSHGMVRECDSEELKQSYISNHTDLNPSFIFCYPGYNMRGTEIGGILGINQLKRLDDNIEKRNTNHRYFLSRLDSNKFKTDFYTEGESNYAFNLVLNKPDSIFVDKLMKDMTINGIEYRRGSAGGGNQLRQPYLKNIVPKDHALKFPNTDHMHFYGFYLGNYPELTFYDIDQIVKVLNNA
jgi:CDP-6-deoxy-D-xylo-4-hexulose-3-dehydrase